MVANNGLASDRHAHILRHLELHGSVTAARIAEDLRVAAVTVRRDLVELEAAGLLVRVHGGAIAPVASETPQSARVTIGVVVPSSVSHFPAIVRGMDAASHGLRARLVLATSQYRPDLEERQVDRLVELGVHGLIIAPTLRGRTEAELASWAARLPVPLVFLERRLRSTALASFDSARTEHERGAAIAVEHLANLGHRSVGLGLFDRTPTAPLIREGFERASDTLQLDAAPIVPLPKSDEALDAAIHELLDRCLATGVRAVLVHTDVHATRVLELATDRAISVPDDLAIVAYDDDVASLAMVPLTAVTAPRRDLGRQALRILTERIAETEERSAPRHLAVLPSLTIRESSGSDDRF